jgi:hypothetical protein
MKNQKEVWLPVKGYEGYYEVSNLGRVKSIERKAKVCGGGFRIVKNRILKNSLNNTGYYRVNLKKKNKNNIYLVHRLVALGFIENPENKRTVNHKDGNKINNNISNLEWNTDLENITHATKVLKSRHNKKYVINIENGKVYETLTELALSGDSEFSKSHLSAMINGHYPNKTKYKYLNNKL